MLVKREKVSQLSPGSLCFKDSKHFSELLPELRMMIVDEMELVDRCRFSGASKIEKSFKHFPELPAELRMMVNDDMLPDDRCRFSRASKRCNIEAKSSKNYIEFIKFLYFSNDKIRIYDRCVESANNSTTRFCLQFEKEGDHQYMKYKRLDHSNMDYKYTRVGKELWREELSNSTTLVEHAVAYFKKLLQTYQKTIKKLEIESIPMSDGLDFDVGDTDLRNLKELKVYGDFNSFQYISKTKRPLKELFVRYWNNEFPLEKIYQVYEYLYIPGLKLNNQQFLQLSATKIYTNIGYLTVRDVFNFLQSWFNGTLGRKMSFIDWTLGDSQFDIVQLLRLFEDYGYTKEGDPSEHVLIKHHKYAGKKVGFSLSHSMFRVSFYYEQNGH